MRIEEMQKINLGEYPTPLEKMTNLSRIVGKGDLYIKRDDTTGPAFGGNKTRKLEYVLKDALNQGCTAILTVGGPQTNHGRTTVAAAIKVGLKPILVLSGSAPDYLSGNLTLDAMMGADIVFAGEDREAATKATMERYEKQGDKVYFLAMGGSDMVGTAGYIMAVPELMKQIEELKIHPKYVVCTFGSMGTFAGLILGAKYFHAPFQVVGVPVWLPEPDALEKAAAFMNQVSAHYDMKITIQPEELKIYNGPGDRPFSGFEYNAPDPLTREYLYLLAKTEGIVLDPTYTGKSFRGFVEMLKDGTLEPDSDPIFIHSGGAVAVWTKEHLDAMQQELFANCTIHSFVDETQTNSSN